MGAIGGKLVERAVVVSPCRLRRWGIWGKRRVKVRRSVSCAVAAARKGTALQLLLRLGKELVEGGRFFQLSVSIRRKALYLRPRFGCGRNRRGH